MNKFRQQNLNVTINLLLFYYYFYTNFNVKNIIFNYLQNSDEIKNPNVDSTPAKTTFAVEGKNTNKKSFSSATSICAEVNLN